MSRKLAGLVIAIATVGTLLGPSTQAFAGTNKRVLVPALHKKSCTWVATAAVVDSGSYFREDDGSLWKCNDGRWTAANAKARTQSR